MNLDALVEASGGQADVDYRKDAGPEGRLLMDALARWVKGMLDVARQRDLEGIDDEEIRDAITDALGFETLDYVNTFLTETYESLDHALAGKYRYDDWKDGYAGFRKDVWDTRTPIGWLALGLHAADGVLDADGIEYAAKVVADAGGVVTWPEGSGR